MKKLIFLLALCLITSGTYAQRLFSEGRITYKVYTGAGKSSIGKFVVLVKGSFIKRVLTLNNGYTNTTIYNGKAGTSATLKTVQGTNYALMLTKEEVTDANKQFKDARYTFEKKKERIAGYNAVRGTVTYPTGKKANIAITQDLRAEDYHFLTMFPDLNGIPLEYEIDNVKSSMRFLASKIEIKM